ncbi:dTDP-4-dehydrorhamnose reductase [Clostridium manihotivorum]|uniref:dTDP-4-dehydrorhamnose reductase n=1 Tax=Clostridium manihotivorum TaxID=2320868 RepID=A0A3R5U5V8_9CLOT|nr:dTDP-4-dehydrorhamnose reductase [Clostridium manihotivorum]QAA32554.1 dTDP-4-dehydrorhamnose reductase [Clostridium manihotivorum]
MKILVTGAGGQVGSELLKVLEKGETELGSIPSELKKAEVFGFSSRELDIRNINQVIDKVASINPDVVINAAAFTNVDGAEDNFDQAFEVNALGPRNLAMACERISAKLVHISTDYVFSGEGSRPFKEYDTALPKSEYGKSKKLGDDFVKEICTKYFIIRPAWVYGYNGKNFVYTILNLAKNNDEIKVVKDQRGNPTNVQDIIHHILKLVVTEEYGIYNCAGHGECSWYDFACKIVEFSKINCKVIPCTSEEYKSKVKRPTYSALDNCNLRITVGDEMRHYVTALKVFINNII